MERSDKIIEYAAYVRYLRKVTFRPSDVEQVCGRVISRASATSEMHMALVLLRRLAAQCFLCLHCRGEAESG